MVITLTLSETPLDASIMLDRNVFLIYSFFCSFLLSATAFVLRVEGRRKNYIGGTVGCVADSYAGNRTKIRLCDVGINGFKSEFYYWGLWEPVS